MNKRKLLLVALSLCMVAILAMGGTLAYLTDTDSAQNVMTLGKVNIIQNEQQFNDAGDKVDFVQNKALLPMVDNRADKDANPVVNGYFDPAMKNVVDKIVTVTNEGEEGAINQDAYVRTILAFETAKEYVEGTTDSWLRDGKTIFDTYIGYLGDFELLTRDTIVYNGVEYVLAVKVYDEPLAPGETTEPSLKQIFMSPDANNENMLLFGEEYTILALSQAVQTAGFVDDNGNGTAADEALDRAFGILDGEGMVDDATLITWLLPVMPDANN